MVSFSVCDWKRAFPHFLTFCCWDCLTCRKCWEVLVLSGEGVTCSVWQFAPICVKPFLTRQTRAPPPHGWVLASQREGGPWPGERPAPGAVSRLSASTRPHCWALGPGNKQLVSHLSCSDFVWKTSPGYQRPSFSLMSTLGAHGLIFKNTCDNICDNTCDNLCDTCDNLCSNVLTHRDDIQLVTISTPHKERSKKSIKVVIFTFTDLESFEHVELLYRQHDTMRVKVMSKNN